MRVFSLLLLLTGSSLADTACSAPQAAAQPATHATGAIPVATPSPGPGVSVLPQATAGGRDIAPFDARTLAFAKAIGAGCNEESGRFECIAGRVEQGDYYDLTFHIECGPADFSVRVERHEELRDQIAPLDEGTVGIATPQDALCVQAAGGIKGEAAYYYVIAQEPGASCVTSGLLGHDRRGCHVGWLRADAVVDKSK